MRFPRALAYGLPLAALAAIEIGLAVTASAQTGPGNPVSVGPYTYTHIHTATTTTIKTRPGILHYVCVNTPIATDTTKLYDVAGANNTTLGIITIPASAGNPFCMVYDALFVNGLNVVTSGNDDETVSWR